MTATIPAGPDPVVCFYCGRVGTRAFEQRPDELGGFQCRSVKQCHRRVERWAKSSGGAQ